MTKQFDIVPFALPRTELGEVRFEQPRDIHEIIVTFKSAAPRRIALSYLKKYWPEQRLEQSNPQDRPFFLGWTKLDDWFTSEWHKAAIRVRRPSSRRVVITFRGLSHEFPDTTDYDVDFRRTLGFRLDVAEPSDISCISAHTVSRPATSRLIVELNAIKKTPGKTLGFETYNACVRTVTPVKGTVRLDLDSAVERRAPMLSFRKSACSFELAVRHMQPAHDYSHDDGLLTFLLDSDKFTVSLTDLEREGPILFEEKGVFIRSTGDKTSLAGYLAEARSGTTLSQQVLEHDEQSLHGAYHGQPRPHAVRYNLGVKHNRHRFMVEPNGDVVLPQRTFRMIKGKDYARFKNTRNGRFFFGLENWSSTARFPDPAPVLIYNIHARHDGMALEQRSFAVPLQQSIMADNSGGSEPCVAMVRFRFTNTSDRALTATLPVHYSNDSRRSENAYWIEGQDDTTVPRSARENLTVRGKQIIGRWHSRSVLRSMVESDMRPHPDGKGIVLTRRLAPGQTCDATLKIPFIGLETKTELRALRTLNFAQCDREVTKFWRREGRTGAQLCVPGPHLADLHASHVTHVQVTDFEMPDNRELINTSVGTATYGNFASESCMIIQELDQRGLHDEARRRLATWLEYQGTVPLPGNYSDHNGVFYGAGGFEQGGYNQHHGCVLWCLAEHYLLTRDKRWFEHAAASMIAGVDWVFRQRRDTMREQPHSRGWESGFLPAGSLEDVTDYYYWLSTNVLTWRGTDNVARALEKNGHSEAARVRKTSDMFARDLKRGFEKMREYSPLVRLRDGRWIPDYPSRLYCRGRDQGWIREVLEGSIYLLITGLYKSTSSAANWILDDYQDNRYPLPPYGYHIPDFTDNWFDRAGFSIQPNLLAGLMPYIERDEPEIYIWMFFNAWCSCYREEIAAMVEHPSPVLGYSNTGHFKTSDQANAMMWLRYMLIYWNHDWLHFGRAVPRAWFKDGQDFHLKGVSTYFGRASVRYRSQVDKGQITMEATIERPDDAPRILARFRHPEKKQFRTVRVNGKPWTRFDPRRQDVDLTGVGRNMKVQVTY